MSTQSRVPFFARVLLVFLATLQPTTTSPVIQTTSATSPYADLNTTVATNGGDIQFNTSTTTDASVRANTESLLTKCEWIYAEEKRNSLFSQGKYELKFHVMKYIVKAGKRKCYVTRKDLEEKLDSDLDEDIIGAFGFACLDPGTELVFLENEEAEQLLGETKDEETDGDLDSQNRNQTTFKFHSRYIQYFQTNNCRIHAKAVWMVANMTDLRVFSVIGERALNLSHLEHDVRLCEGFRNLVSYSVLADKTLQDSLPQLIHCKGSLDNVVEMDLSNNSLTSFPEVLKTVVPNLRSLDMYKNNLTTPVEFTWKPGFAQLPRNLSRTYQFNIHYNFAGAFEMQPNLFRKVLSVNKNKIRNLTDFQFSGEFQYISLTENELKEISDDVFDNVPRVEFLSLALNELTSIPEDLFASLTRLKRLDLQGNKLTWLPNDTFRNLRSLETLNLENNRLEVLQEGLFTNLRELNTLELKNNNLMTISDGAFSTLSVKLTALHLQHNPLEEVPPIVFLLRGLKDINLEYTDIEVLDFVELDRRITDYQLVDALKNPTTGEVLDHEDIPEFQRILSLKNSQLRSMVIYNGTNKTGIKFMLIIKHFTIQTEGSKLACDCNILNVTHILQKWKYEGKLSGAEACLAGWKCIWPDELTGRPVVDLSDSETYCPMEEEGSNVTCPDGCMCYIRTELRTVIVDCKHAGLTSLPETVPPNTTELWLQNNTIQTLQCRPYLQYIETLNLTSNNLKTLPMEALKHMNALKELDLKDNWLTSLDMGVANLKQLQYVRLSGNPFRCDCHTRWMKDWLLSRQSLVPDWSDIKCSTDESEGQIITSVPGRKFICKVSATLGELAVPIAVPVSFFLPILAIIVVAFLQRRRLKVFLYIHTGLHPFDRDPPDDRALYDVTVCCDVSARAWILRNVVEHLENDYKYKVFFYCRDSLVGFTVSENVRHGVKNSRRLVVVLGKNWDKDDLVVTATRDGLAKCRKGMVHFMTVLVHQIVAKDIDNKDIQQYTRRGRYIHTDDKYFLKKLVYEMPHLKSGLPGNRDSTKVPKDATLEHVKLHDILTVAEHEQNKMAENGGLKANKKAYDREISGDSGIMDFKDNADARNGNFKRQDSSPVGDDNRKGVELIQNLLFYREQSIDSYDKPEGNPNAKYVFVWYAEADLPFTLKNIVEPLEKRGHICILQDRDFPVGAAIQENIVRAAENCTRCVLVLSDHTARDEWFTFTFHVAFDRQLQSRDHRVALMKRDNTDVKNFVEEIQQTIKTSALLCEDDPWFWKRLRKFVTFEGYDIC